VVWSIGRLLMAVESATMALQLLEMRRGGWRDPVADGFMLR